MGNATPLYIGCEQTGLNYERHKLNSFYYLFKTVQIVSKGDESADTLS